LHFSSVKVMLKKILIIGAFASLTGCANLSDLSEGYAEMTTSRTVGHWKGTQRCTQENYGATQHAEMKLTKDVMPLMSKGILYIERNDPKWRQPARSWVQVSAESAVGGKAIITGVKILRQEGPLNWGTTVWPGSFVDDNTMSLTACGSELILKRQPVSASAESSNLLGF
jgi:hypothetical protein